MGDRGLAIARPKLDMKKQIKSKGRRWRSKGEGKGPFSTINISMADLSTNPPRNYSLTMINPELLIKGKGK